MGTLKYIIKRFFEAIGTLFGVSIIAFGVTFLTGDPSVVMLGNASSMTTEQIAEFRHNYGFDRPWIVQYMDYLGKLLHGDLGNSLYHKQSNLSLIMNVMPNTIKLALWAFLITVVLSVVIGILIAVYRNSWFDRVMMVLSMVGQSMPIFWLALMLILFFSVKLKWFPVSGMGTWKHLVLPVCSLAVASIAKNIRMIRTCMLDVLSEDYIRTARAKGQSNFIIIVRHGFRNALIPIVTLLGTQFGGLLGGAVVTESVYAWNGIGRLALQAINTKDLYLVQACVIMLAFVFVVINLIVDLSYTFLDPRIKLE